MRKIQIENWVLGLIERVESGQPHEDFRVELKATWIEARRAARKIAGHANAARGEPILWLIGVDEDKGVVGASPNDLANWYSAVAAEFDGWAPVLTDLNVPVNGKTVVALLFETDRAPFVIKNPTFGTKKGGAISHEVPWREGTKTRTARRSDLIRLLTPFLYLPEFDLRSGELSSSFREKDNMVHWRLELELYATLKIYAQGVVIPFHQCDVSFEIDGCFPRTQFSGISLRPPYKPIYKAASVAGITATRLGARAQSQVGSAPDSLTIGHTKNEIFIYGPGVVILTAETSTELSDLHFKDRDTIIEARLTPVEAERSVPISALLSWSEPDERMLGKWILMKV